MKTAGSGKVFIPYGVCRRKHGLEPLKGGTVHLVNVAFLFRQAAFIRRYAFLRNSSEALILRSANRETNQERQYGNNSLERLY
jgi:hypothetical protein